MRITPGRCDCVFTWRSPAIAALVLITFSILNVGARQQGGALPVANEKQGRVTILEEVGPWKMDLLKDPGVLLAEGKNTVPTGQLRLKTYRIEEIALHNPIKVEIDGQTTEMNKAWRLTITGGPFRVRNAPVIVWIDDKPIGFGSYSPDLKSMLALIYDASLLRNGASIGLSYGEKDPGRTTLPEKISIPATHNALGGGGSIYTGR